MKNLLFALLGAFIISAVPAFATTVNVASDGMVWIEKPPSAVSKVEVVFEEGVLDYGDVWKQAFAKKGTIVPVKTHSKYRNDGLFYVEEVSIVDVGIFYDGVRMNIVRDRVVELERKFTLFVFFWLISVLAMSVGVRHVMHVKTGDGFAANIFVAVIVAAVAATSTVIALTAVAATVIAAAFIAIIAAFIATKKMFSFFATMYYVFMAISLLVFLFG